MIAALMTAANLGARVTGWGFIVFTVGSVAWCVVAVGSGQANLLWTNAFLTLVNGVGIWRWLGRQARYEQGGSDATERSAAAPAPDLFAIGALAGSKVTGRDGEILGSVVEAMMKCEGAQLAYLVLSEGGVAGVGERLHAIGPGRLRFGPDGVTSDVGVEDLRAAKPLEPGHWPVAIEPQAPRRDG
jgi:hypothetical protein